MARLSSILARGRFYNFIYPYPYTFHDTSRVGSRGLGNVVI